MNGGACRGDESGQNRCFAVRRYQMFYRRSRGRTRWRVESRHSWWPSAGRHWLATCWWTGRRTASPAARAPAATAIAAQVPATAPGEIAGTRFPGSAVTVLRRMTQAGRATSAGTAAEVAATVGEAVVTVVAVAAAIDAENRRKTQRRLCDLPQWHLFRFIPEFVSTAVWNCLKLRLFLLHLGAHLNID